MKFTKRITLKESGREYLFVVREVGYFRHNVASVYKIRRILGIKFYTLIIEDEFDGRLAQDFRELLEAVKNMVIEADTIAKERENSKRKAKTVRRAFKKWNGEI